MIEQADDQLIVTDLKQYAYCPRITYFEQCLPHFRPRTYKMEAGKMAHEREIRRAARRTLSKYGLDEGQRDFEITLRSEQLGLIGKIDEVVTVPGPAPTVYPVDYKLTQRVSYHHKLQVAAYGLLLEEACNIQVRQGFVYLIPTRKAEQVEIDEGLRQSLFEALETIRAIVHLERMPPPPRNRSRCLNCEFLRACNDL